MSRTACQYCIFDFSPPQNHGFRTPPQVAEVRGAPRSSRSPPGAAPPLAPSPDPLGTAKKNLIKVNTLEHTIPHQVLGVFGAGRVLLKPARTGKGTIAGGAVRAVVEAAGIQNVLTKSIGSKNPHNVIRATFDALLQLRDKEEVAAMRRVDARAT